MGERMDALRARATEKCIPLTVTLELTLRCNLRCVHCYNFDRDLPYLPLKKREEELSDAEISSIAALLDRDPRFIVEGPLRRQEQTNIQRLKEIKSYRGERHRKNLPVRGQRSKTNARTRKGVRKTVAGKKGVKDLR